MTLADVSAKTSIPLSSISHYERGSRRPSAKQLDMLANVYNVKPENIFIPTAKKTRTAETGPAYRSLHRLTKYMSGEEVEVLLDKARAKGDWPTVRDLALELETRKEKTHED